MHLACVRATSSYRQPWQFSLQNYGARVHYCTRIVMKYEIKFTTSCTAVSQRARDVKKQFRRWCGPYEDPERFRPAPLMTHYKPRSYCGRNLATTYRLIAHNYSSTAAKEPALGGCYKSRTMVDTRQQRHEHQMSELLPTNKVEQGINSWVRMLLPRMAKRFALLVPIEKTHDRISGHACSSDSPHAEADRVCRGS